MMLIQGKQHRLSVLWWVGAETFTTKNLCGALLRDQFLGCPIRGIKLRVDDVVAAIRNIARRHPRVIIHPVVAAGGSLFAILYAVSVFDNTKK